MMRKERYRKFISSDEAWFYLKGSTEKRDIQYLRSSERRSQSRVQTHVSHPKGVMVWVAFDCTGFFPPIFIEPKAKINADYYISNILTPFAREYEKRHPNYDYVFQQDSAPAHVARKSLAFLESTKIPFIKPHQWMPCSPDASPCDYWLWGYLKSQVNRRNIRTVGARVSLPLPDSLAAALEDAAASE